MSSTDPSKFMAIADSSNSTNEHRTGGSPYSRPERSPNHNENGDPGSPNFMIVINDKEIQSSTEDILPFRDSRSIFANAFDVASPLGTVTFSGHVIFM